MIKHELSDFSLSSQASSSTSFFTTAPAAPLPAQAQAPHAGTQVHVPAVSALFLIAALLVAATELVERFGASAPRRQRAGGGATG